ncbi:MAG: hypothetical protein R6U98_25180 [Pirellulaceae bacterium]
MSLDPYVRLLNWTPRMLQSGERSTIPKDLASILDHMAIEEEAWLDTVNQYDESFWHAVGSCSSMSKVAERTSHADPPLPRPAHPPEETGGRTPCTWSAVAAVLLRPCISCHIPDTPLRPLPCRSPFFVLFLIHLP